MKLSRDGATLACTIDAGDGSLHIRLRDIASRKQIPVTLPPELGAIAAIEWSYCGAGLFIALADGLLRPWRVLRASLDRSSGTVLACETVHTEPDPAFFLDIGKTKDWRYLLISANAKQTSEVRALDWRRPGAAVQLVSARREGVQYFVEHAHGHLYILSNLGDPDGEYSLYRCVQRISPWCWRREYVVFSRGPWACEKLCCFEPDNG